MSGSRRLPGYPVSPIRGILSNIAEDELDFYLGISVVIATLLGPVLAVYVTRRIDKARQVRECRLTIFRSLMVTRRATLAADKVTALNMVEIDFYGIKPVEDARQEVMAHINLPRPLPADWSDRHRKLLTKLLSEMAKVLGYDLQQIDVLEGGYYPQGFADIELDPTSAVCKKINGHYNGIWAVSDFRHHKNSDGCVSGFG